MQILDGKTLSEQILTDLKLKIINLKPARPAGGLKITLAVILVGEDQSSLKYVELKQKKCQEIGINFKLFKLLANTAATDVLTLIDQLNIDPEITGFFIQLPLPSSLNRNLILNRINRTKDVDGLTDNSPYLPAVVVGTLKLLDHYQLSFTEKNAVIINDSKLVGQPLEKELIKRGARVILANDKTQNLTEISRGADYLFSATGQKGLITSDYIKPQAVVVDIGGGDVDFTSVAPFCSYITPTYGGIGPMTVACLLENLLTKDIK